MLRTEWRYLAQSIALLGGRRVIACAALSTAAINVLALTGSAYMLVLFDWVMPTAGIPGLALATTAMLVLYALGAAIDFARQRTVVAGGERAMRRLTAISVRRLQSRPFRELDAVGAVLRGSAPVALCDTPWLPLYLGALLLLHPLYCALAILGCMSIAVCLLAAPAEAGAIPTATGREALQAARSRTMLRGAILRALRPALQSATLGLGVYLTMAGACHSASGFAAAILVPRLITPLEIILANWRALADAHVSAAHLSAMLAAAPPRGAAIPPAKHAPQHQAYRPGVRVVVRLARPQARAS